jgi:tuftelin-interacting protein 11
LKNKAKGLQTSANPSISTFKDIIEKKAAEHNLLFLPVLNRFKEGKQIYRLGNLNIYIDRNVVFMLQNGGWIPASISEIMQKAL